MQLSPEQLQSVSDLAAISYTNEEISLYLDVDPIEFEAEFSREDSALRYHYDRGILMAKAEIDMANLKRAKDGNLTSIQQWKKDAHFQKIENYKKQLLFDQQQKDYANLQALVETGETKNLPEKVLRYFEQIDYIRCLTNKWKSKNYIVNMVALKWPDLHRRTINELYYESISFFNQDIDVKPEAWANVYADRLDNMGFLALEMGLIEEARRCFNDAADKRSVGKEKPFQVPKELLERKVIIYTTNLKDLGMEPVSRKEVANFIDKLDITEKERFKVRSDAQLEDAPFILIEDGKD